MLKHCFMPAFFLIHTPAQLPVPGMESRPDLFTCTITEAVPEILE